MKVSSLALLCCVAVMSSFAGAGVSLGLGFVSDTGTREMKATGPGGEFEQKEDIDGGGFIASLGFGDIGESRFEFELASYQVGDDARLGPGREISATLGFRGVILVESAIKPFIYAGLGVSRAELEAPVQDVFDEKYIRALQWVLGAGALLPISDRAALNAGVSYIDRAWNDLKIGSGRIETDGQSFRLGVGVELYF